MHDVFVRAKAMAQEFANSPKADESGPVDRALMARVANGDKVALGELYDRYSNVLLGLGVRFLKSQREAEDILHDVFLQVWRDAADYDAARGSVRTWLTMRMRSRCLDRKKSAQFSRSVSLDGHEDGLGTKRDSVPGLDDGRVTGALARLPEDQRAVVTLAYFEGLSCTEIATRLSIPVGTVKSRTAAALGKMRAQLSAEPHRGAL